MLSPIPTDIQDGRRFIGLPTPAGREPLQMGSCAICAVIDGRYYILGFFNLPTDDTGESVSLVPEKEKLHPLEGGVIHKISKIGQIIYRKSNWIIE